MIVKCFSKKDFDKTMETRGITDESVDALEDTYFICIMGTEQLLNKVPFYFKKSHKNVLFLYFDDVSNGDQIQVYSYARNAYVKMMPIVFGEDLATMVLEFIKTITPGPYTKLYVHCMAGISRSAAIALGACDYHGIRAEEFYMLNPAVHPNSVVLRELHNGMA